METSCPEKTLNMEYHTSPATLGKPRPVMIEASTPTWKASKREWLIVIALAIVSLMVAIDATILVTALPVSRSTSYEVKGDMRLIRRSQDHRPFSSG